MSPAACPASDPAMVAMARRYAVRVATRHRSRRDRVDFDRVESAAMLGLVKAAKDYRPDAGRKFSTYAYARIAFEVVDDLRRATASDRKGGNPGSIPVGEDGEPHDPRQSAPHDLDVADAFEALVAPLPARLRLVLRLAYLDPATRGDRDAIAKAAGLRPNTVSKAHAEALAILRARHGLIAEGGRP